MQLTHKTNWFIFVSNENSCPISDQVVGFEILIHFGRFATYNENLLIQRKCNIFQEIHFIAEKREKRSTNNDQMKRGKWETTQNSLCYRIKDTITIEYWKRENEELFIFIHFFLKSHKNDAWTNNENANFSLFFSFQSDNRWHISISISIAFITP